MRRKYLMKSVAFMLAVMLIAGTSVNAEELIEGESADVEASANPPNRDSPDDIEAVIEDDANKPVEPTAPVKPEEPVTLPPTEEPEALVTPTPPAEADEPDTTIPVDKEHKVYTLTVVDKVLNTDGSVISSEVRSETVYNEGAGYFVKALNIEGVVADGVTEYSGFISEDTSIEFIYKAADANIQTAAVTFTVTFDSDGGTSVPSQTIEDGGKVAEPPAPSKAGYIFGGWYESKYSGSVPLWEFAWSTVTKDIFLKALWREPVHTVTFNSNGGTPVAHATIQVADGDKIIRPSEPTKEGYIFRYWGYERTYTSVDGSGSSSGEWIFDYSTVIEDMELYAVWDEAVTVAFDTNGGTSVSAQTVAKWQRAKEPVAPTREGYRFLKWTYNDIDWSFERQSVTENMTLVAQWEKVEAHPSPTVTRPESHPSPEVVRPDNGSYSSPAENQPESGSHPSPVANRPDANVPEPKMGDMDEFPVYMVFGVLMMLELLLKRKR